MHLVHMDGILRIRWTNCLACAHGDGSARPARRAVVLGAGMTGLRGDQQQLAAREGGMVERQAAPNFLNPAHEWRRLFAEAWGTFLLVLVAAGGGVVAARSGGTVSLGMVVVAPGLMVMAIIYFMGSVSGAHLNPAVTLAFAVRGNFPWRRVPGYVLAQVLGGVAAALFLRAMFGTAGALGATVPGSGVAGGTALAMEVVLTAGLVNTILGTA